MGERRGWVSGVGVRIPEGVPLRASDQKNVFLSLGYEPGFWKDNGSWHIEMWTGCPTCDREDPHECVQTPQPRAQDAQQSIVGPISAGNRLTSVEPVTGRWTGCRSDWEKLIEEYKPVYARTEDVICDLAKPYVITSQAQLALAMFVAANLDEIMRRSEGRDPVRSNTHVQRITAVMWDDPAYARQRRECESAAERVWAARRVAK